MTELKNALESAIAQQKSLVPGEPAIQIPLEKILCTGGKNGEPLQAYIQLKDISESLAISTR